MYGRHYVIKALTINYGRHYVIKALTFNFDNWKLITIGLVKAGVVSR